MDLYHSDIRLPDGFTKPTARVELVWTRHADAARTDDRYGQIPRFANVPLSMFDVIEVGVEAGKVSKMLVRGHYSADIDVCFVLIPCKTDKWIVKTVWQNERTDVHRTLDRSRYVA